MQGVCSEICATMPSVWSALTLGMHGAVFLPLFLYSEAAIAHCLPLACFHSWYILPIKAISDSLAYGEDSALSPGDVHVSRTESHTQSSLSVVGTFLGIIFCWCWEED